MKEPYKISFVVTSRNDNHGEGMMKRMRIFVRGLLHQTRKYNLRSELIMVEWNPVPGMPMLRDMLPAPSSDDVLDIRYVVVPPSVHQQYRTSDQNALYQMIAKNVGIRRAQSDWIICTNVDLLFSDALMRFLAGGGFNKNTFYRCNRCDIPAEINENDTVEKQLDFAGKNILQRLGKQHNYKNLQGARPLVYKTRPVAYVLDEAAGLKRKYMNDLLEVDYAYLDKDACGDFTMMSSAAWEDIQGYVEFDLYSIHIDTLALGAAYALGYKQIVLPPEACAYHIFHGQGWESNMNPIEKAVFTAKRPGLPFEMVRDMLRYIFEKKIRFDINKPDWGYEGMNFEEFILKAGSNE